MNLPQICCNQYTISTSKVYIEQEEEVDDPSTLFVSSEKKIKIKIKFVASKMNDDLAMLVKTKEREVGMINYAHNTIFSK